MAVAKQSELIEPIYADIRDETSVALAVDNCGAAVNAVGLYVERKAETFELVHEIGALNVAHQAIEQGLQSLVHISGIGADLVSPSRYVHSRGKAELLVADVLAGVTILRPSVIFGPADRFINTLERIIRRMPVVPLFGSGETRLQPVYVRDVAEAVLTAVVDDRTSGKTYELGGPHIYSYRTLIELLLKHTRRKRTLLPVPFAVWDMLAAALSILPNPPITDAQVTLMRGDNVVAKGARSLVDLGITPTPLESVLSQYRFS